MFAIKQNEEGPVALQKIRHLTDSEIAAVTGAVIEPPAPPPGGTLEDIIRDALNPKPIEEQVIVH